MKAVYIYAIVAICLLVVGTFLLLPEYNQKDLFFGAHEDAGDQVYFPLQRSEKLDVWKELNAAVQRAAAVVGYSHGVLCSDRHFFVAAFWDCDWCWDDFDNLIALEELKKELEAQTSLFGRWDVKCEREDRVGWGAAPVCTVIKAYFYF